MSGKYVYGNPARDSLPVQSESRSCACAINKLSSCPNNHAGRTQTTCVVEWPIQAMKFHDTHTHIEPYIVAPINNISFQQAARVPVKFVFKILLSRNYDYTTMLSSISRCSAYSIREL